MSEVKTILLNRSVYADNDQEADALRLYLKDHGVFLVNVMSSPGAGKTTTLHFRLLHVFIHYDRIMSQLCNFVYISAFTYSIFNTEYYYCFFVCRAHYVMFDTKNHPLFPFEITLQVHITFFINVQIMLIFILRQ